MKINKKLVNILWISIFFLVVFNVSVWAKENKYLVTETYTFDLSDNLSVKSNIRILLGKINGSTYQDGYINITPKPNAYEEDDFGNKTAIYKLAGKTEKTFKVVIKKYSNIREKNIDDKENIKLDRNVSKVYFQSGKNIESDNEKIILKANELTKNCKNDYEKLRNIFEFVNLYIEYNTSDTYRNKGALSALENKKGVCEEYATLFTALCRASNIPARVVSGFRLPNMKAGDSIEPTEYYHSWAEVNFEQVGWIPFELSTEYNVNNNRVPYWDGFMQLGNVDYVLEGIYSDEDYQVKTVGIKKIDVKRTIELIDTTYFEDIKGHWAESYIGDMYNKKIAKGYTDNTFKPNNQVTRIEFLVMLKRTLENTKTNYYSNVEIYYPLDFVKNWSKEEYDKLMKYYAYNAKDNSSKGAGYNIINYVFNGKIKMNEPITREEVAALISPFLTQKNVKTKLIDIYDSKFIDSINNLVSNSIITGYTDGTYRPKNNISRAETCTILQKLLNNI